MSDEQLKQAEASTDPNWKAAMSDSVDENEQDLGTDFLSAESGDPKDPIFDKPAEVKEKLEEPTIDPVKPAVAFAKAAPKRTYGTDRIGMTHKSLTGEEIKTVNEIKLRTAELLDLIAGLSVNHKDAGRVKATAMTKYEDACLWGVKAATL